MLSPMSSARSCFRGRADKARVDVKSKSGQCLGLQRIYSPLVGQSGRSCKGSVARHAARPIERIRKLEIVAGTCLFLSRQDMRMLCGSPKAWCKAIRMVALGCGSVLQARHSPGKWMSHRSSRPTSSFSIRRFGFPDLKTTSARIVRPSFEKIQAGAAQGGTSGMTERRLAAIVSARQVRCGSNCEVTARARQVRSAPSSRSGWAGFRLRKSARSGSELRSPPRARRCGRDQRRKPANNLHRPKK